MIQFDVCPNQECLHDHLSGLLGRSEEEQMIAHLDTCAACQATLVSLSVAESGILETARQVGLHPLTSTDALAEALERLKSPGALAVSTEKEVLQLLRPSQYPESLGRLNHYELMELIGRGGMGIVFRALDTQLQRTVAIKVLPTLGIQPRTRERFLREAQAAAAVRHENVVVVHSVESDQGLLFLVMEYVPGITLQEWIEHHRLPMTQEICGIGAQIAQGLSAAHEQGLIHRDIKPSNILLTRIHGLEHVKIMDFGLARALRDPGVTHPGMLIGTPAYMSPEQATGKSVDYRTDLFSLGSVLHAMCTGQPPFVADEVMAVLGKVAQAHPVPVHESNPGISHDLSALIQRLHAIDPERRPASAQAVADELAALQRGMGTQVANRNWSKRKYLVAAGVLVVALTSLLLAQTVIRIRDKDGKVTETKVLDGATVEIVKDGKQVAILSAAGNSSAVRSFDSVMGPIWNLAFAGKRILTAGADSWVRVWDLETAKELHRFDGHRHTVYAMAISPDGRLALTGSGSQVLDPKNHHVDWTVCLWEVETGKQLHSHQGHGPGITSVAFSRDGNRALFCAYDGFVQLWDVKAWRQISRFGDASGLWSVCFSPDETRALTAGGLENHALVRLWDLQSGREVRRFEGHKFGTWHAVFSRDGRSVLSAGQDHCIRLWEADTARQRSLLRHDEQVARMALSRDGRFVLAGTWGGEVRGNLRIWRIDNDSPQVVHTFQGHDTAINAVAWSFDGRHVLSGGHDGTVRLWNVPPSLTAPSTLPNQRAKPGGK